jgi:hypothetical protein
LVARSQRSRLPFSPDGQPRKAREAVAVTHRLATDSYGR